MNFNAGDKDSVLRAQSETLNLLTVAKKKLAGRKPKKDLAERELTKKRAEAIQRVEEAHKKKNAKLLTEISELEKQIAILSKRYIEFSNDVIRLTETPFPTPANGKPAQATV